MAMKKIIDKIFFTDNNMAQGGNSAMNIENLIRNAHLAHFPKPTGVQTLINRGKELGAAMAENAYLLIRNNIPYLPPALVGATIIFPETGTDRCKWTIRTWADEGSVCAALEAWHGPEDPVGVSLLILGS